MLELRSITAGYTRNAPVVRDVSLTVGPGESVGLLGRGGEVPGLVAELAPAVGLTPDLLTRRPHEVSDGRLQRACLAPALVLRPACWCATR
ncbi:ABC-type glutathione transport system ATPase component [Streptomyces luteogriseus]|uniref:ABC-type glutathione transport system ATPase component n=1 Tax=Streptomyces luteogriseus TaxID=68233 RepID=A0A7W7DJB9_9ACTN|nr:ABC-type glutathione transport system ATPase component [Streptomyces luteogriseus]